VTYILQIETATTNCSVALSKNGKTIAVKEVNDGYSHAENIHVFIKNILAENKLEYANLSAIAVSKGPGSFTGLRIGVSSAKGLCFALDIPLISIDTLQVLAKQTQITEGVIISMIDARRMEAYTAVYNKDYQLLKAVSATVFDIHYFEDYLEKGKVAFLGNAVDKLQTVLQHENAIFLEEVLPSANEMSALSFDKFQESDFEDVAYFEPYYLKDFVVTPPKKKTIH